MNGLLLLLAFPASKPQKALLGTTTCSTWMSRSKSCQKAAQNAWPELHLVKRHLPDQCEGMIAARASSHIFHCHLPYCCPCSVTDGRAFWHRSRVEVNLLTPPMARESRCLAGSPKGPAWTRSVSLSSSVSMGPASRQNTQHKGA